MPDLVRLHTFDHGPYRHAGAAGRLWVIWPEPVNDDACFRHAGFERFGGGDEWYAEWQALVGRLAAALRSRGTIAFLDNLPTPRRSLRAWLPRRPPPPPNLLELLLDSLSDDRVGALGVSAGAPPELVVWASNGHPLLWLWIAEGQLGEWPALLATLADGRPVAETPLRWEHLMPVSLPFERQPERPEGPRGGSRCDGPR